jgi:hypothetical protein
MTLLDDPDNWADKLQEFAAVENGARTKVVFIAGVPLLNSIRNSDIPIADCKVVVFDEIDHLMSIDGIDLHDASFNDDDEVWEFSKVSNDGLNGALAGTFFGHDQDVEDGETEDPHKLEAESSGVEDVMGGERTTADTEERHSSLLPIFGAQQPAEEESAPEVVETAAEETPKRKRGRPPKAKVEGAAEEKPKRKRGRPPKVRDEVAELLSKRRPPQKEEEGEEGATVTQKRRSKIDVSAEAPPAAPEVPGSAVSAEAPAEPPQKYKIIEKSLSGRIDALVSKLQGNDRKEYLDAVLLWAVGILTDDRYTKVRNHFLDKLDKRRVKGTEGFITGDYGNKMFDAFYDVKVFGTSIEEAAKHHKVIADDLFYVVDLCPDLGDKPKFQWKPDPEFIKLRKKQLRAKS